MLTHRNVAFTTVIVSFHWSVVMCVIEAYFVQSQPTVAVTPRANGHDESQLSSNMPKTCGDTTVDQTTEVVSRQLDFWHLKVV